MDSLIGATIQGLASPLDLYLFALLLAVSVHRLLLLRRGKQRTTKEWSFLAAASLNTRETALGMRPRSE